MGPQPTANKPIISRYNSKSEKSWTIVKYQILHISPNLIIPIMTQQIIICFNFTSNCHIIGKHLTKKINVDIEVCIEEFTLFSLIRETFKSKMCRNFGVGPKWKLTLKKPFKFKFKFKFRSKTSQNLVSSFKY